MERKDAIQACRRRGGKVVGVLPGRYPWAVLDALGILPVEMWDPPGPVSGAGRHLQPFVCSVVQRALELILRKQARMDLLLFPHLCDSVQNLMTVVRDTIPVDMPCFTFYPPRNAGSAGALEFVAAQVRELAREVGALVGRALSDEELAQSLARSRAIHGRVRGWYERRAEGRGRLSNVAFYDLVRRWEYVNGEAFSQWPEELPGTEGDEAGGLRVVLSGVLPDRGLLRLLDARGIRVVEDDLLSCGRRLLRKESALTGDPWLGVAGDLLALPPCSSVASPVEQRVAFIRELLERSRADALVVHTVKFCEVELFDHPFVIDPLKAAGIPVLLLESELHQGQYGQMETRTDAFIEMLT